MADDTRYRSQQDPDYARSRPAADGGRVRRGPEDPLAELARLIGQEDPFADFTGGARPRARTSLPSPDTRTRQEPRYDDRDRSYRSRAETAERGSLDRYSTGNSRSAYSYGTTRSERDPGDNLTIERESRDPLLARRSEDEPYSARSTRTDDPESAFESTRTGTYDPKYSDDAYLPEHGEAVVEEVQPKRRGRTLVIVAALLGIAIVGAAGTFGYRTIFGPTAGKQPPVIGPQAGPNKVPPTATSQPEASKQIYDRIPGDPKPNERVVPRIETPIDLAARTGPVPTPAPSTPAVTPAPAAPTAPPTSTTEPRRVRTLTVRADGSIVSEPTAPVRTPAPAVTPPRPSTQPAPAPAPARPLAVNPYAPATEEPEETPTATPTRAPTTTTTPAPRPATQPTQGPVWPPLQTQTATQPTGPGTTPVRIQTQTPTIQTAPAASGYVVQVSSQRSEAEAQNAWRSLQARYAAVLGSQQATIRRADLGERGTFYRAQVGPFTSREPADQLCQRLKAAGGECLVQRN